MENKSNKNANKKMVPLIGFTGPAHSGKDTACDYLVQTYRFSKYSFAVPIKRALMAMFGLSHRQVNGDLKETDLDWLEKSPRELMQTLGTEWGRDLVCRDVWIKALQRDAIGGMELAEQFDEVWVGMISDVRFPDEATWVRDNGGVIVHIMRPGAKGVSAHSSENGAAMEVGDIVIINNGTFQDLQKKLDDFVTDLSIKRFSIKNLIMDSNA